MDLQLQLIWSCDLDSGLGEIRDPSYILCMNKKRVRLSSSTALVITQQENHHHRGRSKEPSGLHGRRVLQARGHHVRNGSVASARLDCLVVSHDTSWARRAISRHERGQGGAEGKSISLLRSGSGFALAGVGREEVSG